MKKDKWIKVYLTKEQHDEWKCGNGRAIGYLEEEVIAMCKLENEGIDCGLSNVPLDYMTKVPPERIEPVSWSRDGFVYVR